MKHSCVMVGTLLLASLGTAGCVVESVENEGGEDALGEAEQALSSSPALRDFGQVQPQTTAWRTVTVDSQGVTVSGCQCGVSGQHFGVASCPTTFKGQRNVGVSFSAPASPGTYTGTFSITCGGPSSLSATSNLSAVAPIGVNHNGTLLRAGGAKPKAGRKAARQARTTGAARSTRRAR
ncbi:hypothetical protein WME73_25820 [Sorangium sp. So ce302]|uniref:hypothetical protein n=1 Tax=Sorangium sp. So ce302 TaxID=3133297 RepID=UPI003F60CEF1